MLPIPQGDPQIYVQIQDMTRKFADDVIRPAAEALDRDETFPGEIFQQMAQLGLFGISTPEACGDGQRREQLPRPRCDAARRELRHKADGLTSTEGRRLLGR